MISFFDLTALLLTLCAVFGWINRRFVRLPNNTGLLLMGLAASLLLILVEVIYPHAKLYESVTDALERIDFTDVVMNGMLAFLLFAGALGLNVTMLRDRAWPVVALALVGTLISTIVVGVATYFVARGFGMPLSLMWSLAFGALISPTDPIAVISTLKNVRVPESLQVEMQGEALFNDGVGIVLFTLLVGLASSGANPADAIGGASLHLLLDAGGGLLLGLVTGYLAYRAMRQIDDFPIEVLITLALVTGTFALARFLGVSGPLSVVAAGLLVGNRAPGRAMSEKTEKYVSALWTLIDEILNSVLFLLIGLEVIILRFNAQALLLAVVAIPIVLLARLVAVSAPLLMFPWSDRLNARNIPFLTWAGVRGGISVALALSLPEGPAKPVILAATYVVVLFTLVVQSSTLGWVARRTLHLDPDPETQLSPGH